MTPPSEHNRSRRIATGPVMAGDTQQSVEALRIGPRLREARLRRKFSLDQLAKNTGLTKGFISQLERDMTSASVASLVRLCEALQISVGSLFQAPRTLLTTAAEAPAINFGGSGLKEQLLSPRDNALQVIRSEIAPGGGSGEEPYSLDADAEVVHVLHGQIVVHLDEDVYTLQVGDTLSFSPRQPHSFYNPSRQATAVVLWALTPSPW
jgi:transcriptional regulator with XRE-family HTH domain